MDAIQIISVFGLLGFIALTLVKPIAQMFPLPPVQAKRSRRKRWRVRFDKMPYPKEEACYRIIMDDTKSNAADACGKVVGNYNPQADHFSLACVFMDGESFRAMCEACMQFRKIRDTTRHYWA